MTMSVDWEARYRAGQTPWDLKGPTPVFGRLITEGHLPIGKLLVPGAGLGHDALAFARAGYAVTSVDVAASACADLRARSSAAGVTLDVLEADFFTMTDSATYDLMLEQTFYCAIDPSARDAYRDQAHRLLKPGGLLFGLFFPLEARNAAGPPHVVRPDELRASLSERFELLHEEWPADSIKPRAGNEILQIWRRLG